MKEFLGQPGIITTLAVLVYGLLRLFQTGAINRLLAKIHLPPLPDYIIPWLALFLGAAGALLDDLIKGMTWKSALLAAFDGLLAGAFAVAGNETVVKTPARFKAYRESQHPKAMDKQPSLPEIPPVPPPPDDIKPAA